VDPLEAILGGSIKAIPDKTLNAATTIVFRVIDR